MIDKAISDFFQGRQDDWLKKNLKSDMSVEEIAQKQQECEQKFALNNWLPDAARRAGQISLATHPCTFSHPSARKNKNGDVTPTIVAASQQNDGFVRSGNIKTVTDALGNAAALDVYKFLQLELADGRALIEHIVEDTSEAQALLTIPSASYAELKAGFLAMRNPGEEVITSSKIKQVYFPVAADYHQLSILTPSGIVFELRQRIDALRFGDELKAKRELRKNLKYSATGYREIYDITTIGYGGTKPQNISVLNNQNAGKAHLLLSVPPKLQQRKIAFPKRDFFQQSIRYTQCSDSFRRLHNILQQTPGDPIPRQKLLKQRDNCLHDILQTIIEISWSLRAVSAEQYNPANSELTTAQTIWLVADKQAEREQNDAWLAEIVAKVRLWIQQGYQKTLRQQAAFLGPAEQQQWLQKWLTEQQEALR